MLERWASKKLIDTPSGRPASTAPEAQAPLKPTRGAKATSEVIFSVSGATPRLYSLPKMQEPERDLHARPAQGMLGLTLATLTAS